MSDQPNTMATPTMDTDVEFRVLIRGLKLDQATRALIYAAIRSAILHEVATIDTGSKNRIVSPSEDRALIREECSANWWDVSRHQNHRTATPPAF
jgi:hypothetical protein